MKQFDLPGVRSHIQGVLGYRRNRRVIFSASTAVLQRIVLVVSTLLLTPMLLHILGTAQFGIWGAATSLGWLGGLADLGTGSALVTLVARSLAGNRSDEAREHIESALAIAGALPALLVPGALITLAVAPHITFTPYLIAILALAMNAPLNIAGNVWMALQKGYIAGLWELVQTVLTMAGLIGATFFTTEVRIYIAALYAAMLLANLGSLIHLWICHPELRPRRLPTRTALSRELAAHGGMYFILGVTGNLSFMLDNVLTLQLLGPVASAQMAIALRFCITAISILGVMSQPLWPAFADAVASADRAWIRKALLRGMAVLVGLALIGSSILILFGGRLLQWWLHSTLQFRPFLLWTMAIWIVVQALSRVPSLLLNGLSILRFQVLACTVGTIVAFALKFFLVQRIGIEGILWGTTLTAFFIVIPGNLWRIHKWSRTLNGPRVEPEAAVFHGSHNIEARGAGGRA